MEVTARTLQLQGTSYEVGRQLGQMVKPVAPLKKMHTGGMAGFGKEEVEQARQMFNRWCPGLTEELHGFADALEATPQQILYYGMTYLRPRPRCSHVALLPGATQSGRPLVARNYEFNHEQEDFCLMKTSVQGKYTHMGTSVLFFGRDDGFNEHGLAVTMSSCGFPVGPMPYMRVPQIVGLQFWAVTRALLENCQTVQQALNYMQGMPVAYNLNLIVTDKAGNAALVETLDGRFAVQQLTPQSEENYIHATNHPVLPQLIPHEPKAMRHSLERYNWIKEQIKGKTQITPQDLKKMLLAEYPNGLCCHYYQDFFGTTKSMVIDPGHGTIDLCWGGSEANGWQQYNIANPLPNASRQVKLTMQRFTPEMGQYVPLV